MDAAKTFKSTRQSLLVALALVSGLGFFSTRVAEAEEGSSESWTDKIKLMGDLRLRQEMIHYKKDFTEDRHRTRMRVRLGVQVNLEDNLTGVIRVATANASENVTSTNETFTGTGSRKGIGFDLAYIEYRPFSELKVWGGKSPNPFFTPGKNDMIFDSDWTPEGGALKANFEMGDFFFGGNAGLIWLEERKGSATVAEPDAILYGVQLLGGYKTSEGSATLSLSHYAFTNLEDRTVLVDPTKPFGNSATCDDLATDCKYNFQYTPYTLGLELESSALIGIPVTLYGEWAQNPDPDKANNAFIAGLRLNKAKEAGSWQLDYNFRRLEKDSLVGAITDSDNIGGGTNGQAHKISGTYQIASSTATTLTYYLSEKNLDDKKDYQRAQLDVVFTF